MGWNYHRCIDDDIEIWVFNNFSGLSRCLRINDFYIQMIGEGKKNTEIRVGYRTIRNIKNGDSINLISERNTLHINVTQVNKYNSFQEMLEVEDYHRIFPEAKNKLQSIEKIKKIYSQEKERTFGVFAFKIKL